MSEKNIIENSPKKKILKKPKDDVVRVHETNCEECKENILDDKITLAYQKAFEKIMTDQIKDYLGTREDLINDLDEFKGQNLPITVFQKKIYLAPLFAILSFGIIVMTFFLYWKSH